MAAAAADGLLAVSRMWNRARSCGGVSLVEAMIAVALLAVGVLSLARGFTVSAAVLERANRSSTSAILAAQKIEALRTVAARSAAPAEGTEFVDGRGVPVERQSHGTAAGYVRRWSVRASAADPDRVRVVHVRVTPRLSSGEVALTTLAVREEP
jgi:Tfp pilus assembly protein PilV